MATPKGHYGHHHKRVKSFKRRLTNTALACLVILSALLLHTAHRRMFCQPPLEQNNNNNNNQQHLQRDTATNASSTLSPQTYDLLQSVGRCTKLINVCWDHSQLVVDTPLFSDTKTAVQGGIHPYQPALSGNKVDNFKAAHSVGKIRSTINPLGVRARSLFEPTLKLQQPTYTTTKIPIVVYPYHIYNFGYTYQRLASWLYHVFSHASEAEKAKLQITVVTPDGLAMPAFAYQLMQPFSVLPVQTLPEASNREPNNDPCFKEMVICTGNPIVNLWSYGQYLASHSYMQQKWSLFRTMFKTQNTAAVSKLQPANKYSNKKLQVAFEVRPAARGRQFLNMDQLLADCNAATIQNTRLQCTTVDLPDIDTSATALKDIDVLISYHGAGTINSFLMKPGSNVIEVLPLDIVDHVGYIGRNEEDRNSQLFWWQVYLCDPTLSTFSEMEKKTGEPRGLVCLQREMTLPWKSLASVLEASAQLNSDINKYRQLAANKGNVFFIQPHGKTESADLVSSSKRANRCPQGAEWRGSRDKKWAPPYPKTLQKNDTYLDAIWIGSPYPRGWLVLFTECSQPASLYFDDDYETTCSNSSSKNKTLKCPDYMSDVVKIRQAALDAQLTVISLSYGIKPEQCSEWDVETVDMSIVTRTISYIRNQENMRQYTAYAVGLGNAAPLAVRLGAALPADMLQGVILFKTHVNNLEKHMKGVMGLLPSVAVIEDVSKGVVDQAVLDNSAYLKAVGSPVMAIASATQAVTVAAIQRWLQVESTTTAAAVLSALQKLHFLDDKNYNKLVDTTASEVVEALQNQFGSSIRHAHGLHELKFWAEGVYGINGNENRFFELISWLRYGGVGTLHGEYETYAGV